MNKKIFVWVIGLIAVGLVATNTVSSIERKAKDELYKQVELFSFALTAIQSEYVDEINPKDLIYGALKGMLSSLDAHSQFLTPDSYKELKSETEGQFGGLGIEITIKDGLLTVVTPIEDTPAWKAGIKSNDRIIKIDNEITRDITLPDALKKLRGKPNTQVNISVLREDADKLLEFKLTREIIKINDVREAKVLEDNIGYIRLIEFRENTMRDFETALEKLKNEGIDSLILDLRNNPGGLLNVAIKASEIFLPAGSVIVSTKGRLPSQESVFKSRNTKNAYISWPMVILINEGSASGSEILAGALQDNKRAIIVGIKSFGKSSVQTVIPLADGSAVRLTTSRYFTPLGKSIHETGIQPDVVIPFEEISKKEEVIEDKNQDIFEKLEKETKLTQSIEIDNKLLQDNQIRQAVNILKGIKTFQHQK